MKADRIYTNGKIQGTLADVNEFLSLMSEIALDEGHTRLYIQRMKESIYEQFDVPKDERTILKVVRTDTASHLY